MVSRTNLSRRAGFVTRPHLSCWYEYFATVVRAMGRSDVCCGGRVRPAFPGRRDAQNAIMAQRIRHVKTRCGAMTAYAPANALNCDAAEQMGIGGIVETQASAQGLRAALVRGASPQGQSRSRPRRTPTTPRICQRCLWQSAQEWGECLPLTTSRAKPTSCSSACSTGFCLSRMVFIPPLRLELVYPLTRGSLNGLDQRTVKLKGFLFSD